MSNGSSTSVKIYFKLLERNVGVYFSFNFDLHLERRGARMNFRYVQERNRTWGLVFCLGSKTFLPVLNVDGFLLKKASKPGSLQKQGHFGIRTFEGEMRLLLLEATKPG